MKLHANAPFGPKGRRWRDRYLELGDAGLVDRSSRPKLVPHRTSPEREAAVAALRRLRMTGAEIAMCLGMALSTVSAVLKRIGLGKLSRLDPIEPPNRYERRQAGELLHIDIKKLGRIPAGGGHRARGRGPGRHHGKGLGWDYVHVCIDDATRLAYVEILPNEQGTTVTGFLRRAVAFYRRYGIRVERVITDNGAGYRSALHALACRTLGIRHLRTRPYRPRTNGKAERFIRTLLGGWAYGAFYSSTAERAAALDGWLWTYNYRRPHGALCHQAPAARLNELTNVTRSYS